METCLSYIHSLLQTTYCVRLSFHSYKAQLHMREIYSDTYPASLALTEFSIAFERIVPSS